MYADVSFSIKLEVAGWRKDSGAGALLWILRNFYERLISRISFLQHFGTHPFQINFRVLHNLKEVFRTISNIYNEAFSQIYLAAFSRCIFAENVPSKIFDRVLYEALQPSFFIFFHFLCLDTWMNDINILLLFWKCAAILLTLRKLEIL